MLDRTLLALSAFSLLIVYIKRRSSRLPLPPGPAKLPLVGNLFGLPSSFEWETYMKWSKDYASDIIHIGVAGTSIIVLSSVDVAFDLLEQRSAIYSDRPVEIPSIPKDFKHVNIKDREHRWRERRRLLHSSFHMVAARRFRPQQRSAAHALLRRLLEDPDGEIMAHIRHMNGSMIMSIAYGIDSLPSNDPYMKNAEAVAAALLEASVPGRYLVDSLPILKYVPDWFFGAGFKREAKYWKCRTEDMVRLPFGVTKRLVAEGTAPASFAADKLQEMDEDQDREHQEKVIEDTTGIMYIAGFDTTTAAIGTFILAMLAYPDVQKKAQKEIDAVVRTGHLPNFDDEESLPYISAIVKEVLRWRPVTPIAVPHFVAEEDVYRGYRIPARSIVIPNTWAMLHDEVAYPDPYSFNPDRFMINGQLNPAVRDPEIAFGFGRRVCPGRHMAQSTLWVTIASLLAVFDINKAIGEDGKVLEPSYEYHSSVVAMPLPFKCSIKPRSKESVALITATSLQ
ncbi:cytochrome P450 [Mycena rebaudengoi]|nr:cytochrome P450 [Mycena rebaudengoi]